MTNSYVPLTLLSILDSFWKSRAPNAPLPSIEAGTDFEPFVFYGLMLVGLSLCVANYVFLKRNEISSARLKHDRRVGLMQQNRVTAEFQLPGWLRVLGNLVWKVGLIPTIYFWTSGSVHDLVRLGFIASACFIAYNVRLITKAVLHPRSVFNRRYLFYRTDPAFVQTRLLFELTRRFLYMVVGFALAFYGLHRLTGDGSLFATILKRLPYRCSWFISNPLWLG